MKLENVARTVLSQICCHRQKHDAFGVIQGWYFLDTVIAAESLALTLQASGNTTDSKELLERLLQYLKPGKLIFIFFSLHLIFILYK